MQRDEPLSRRIRDIAVGALSFLLIALVLLGFAEGFGYWQVPVILALGLFIGGALVGFIFGIPKVSNAPMSEPNGKASYRGLEANTNLEQISDWLTKIIVGLGLIELRRIPAAVESFAVFIGPAFRASSSVSALAAGITIYFPILGFISGYLITRLYLSSLIGQADIRLQSLTSEVSGLIIAATAQTKKGEEAAPPAVAQAVTRQVQSTVGSGSLEDLAGGRVLWVDDRPQNNAYLIQAFQRLAISVDLALSTDEALAKLAAMPTYDAIITDMGRPPDHRAGYTLLAGLRERKINIPTIVYAGSDSEEHREEARAAGAIDSTNRPQKVFEFVVNAVLASQRKSVLSRRY